jgi:threonyl-tRNA synthetase
MGKAENAIINAAKDKVWILLLNMEAAFYGPSWIYGKRCLGRQWQWNTIQVDYHYQNVLI